MEELYASIAKPGIFTPHHYMTFFKVIHRALPTNTRFNGSKLCRLGCGCTETFVHWFHCKHIFPIWRAMANILTALGCGQYNCNRELVFLTLKRLRNGERRLINKHMRGIVWLTWKFLWQQLAEIGTSESGQGTLDENLIFDSVFRMHYTCVLAALREHELVERAETLGSRRKRRKAVREASMFRVAPFVIIDDTDETHFKLKDMYKTLLDKAGVKHFES